MNHEQLIGSELTPEESLTLKMNDVLPQEWEDTLFGEMRERGLTLDDGWSIHLQQSRDESGRVTSRLQIGYMNQRLPTNHFIEWSPDKHELTNPRMILPIDIDLIHKVLDFAAEQPLEED